MIATTRRCMQPCRRQRGAVLFVSLVILLMLSLFAIATANTAIMENKMAGAARNMQLARFAADSAMSEARIKVAEAAAAYGAAEVCSHLRCFVRAPGLPYATEELVRTQEARAALNVFRLDFTRLDGVDESSRLAASPGYLIEDLGIPPPASPPQAGGADTRHSFRITALGMGARDYFEHVIESVYFVAN